MNGANYIPQPDFAAKNPRINKNNPANAANRHLPKTGRSLAANSSRWQIAHLFYF